MPATAIATGVRCGLPPGNQLPESFVRHSRREGGGGDGVRCPPSSSAAAAAAVAAGASAKMTAMGGSGTTSDEGNDHKMTTADDDTGGRRTTRRRRSRKRRRKSRHGHVVVDDDDVPGDHRGDENINGRAAFAVAFPAPAAADEKCNAGATDEGTKVAAATGSNGVACKKRKRGDEGGKNCRASSSGGGMGDDEDIATASMTDQDRMHHWMMARVIVAPFTSPLMMSIERQVIIKEEEEERERRYEENRRGSGGAMGDSTVGRGLSSSVDKESCSRKRKRKRTATSFAGLEAFSLDGSPSFSPQDDSSSSTRTHVEILSTSMTTPPKNVYESFTRGINPVLLAGDGIPFVPSTAATSFSSLQSSPRESLETIVDGAVCTLVRRSYRFRALPSSSRKEDAFVINRGRRRRRPNANQGSIVGKSSSDTHYEIKRDNCNEKSHPPECGRTTRHVGNVRNHWLLGENLLSAGYSLGSCGDQHRSMIMNSRVFVPHHANSIVDDDGTDGDDNDRRGLRPISQSLRGCPNMAPGIHCLHPNTLTSYARLSPFMR